MKNIICICIANTRDTYLNELIICVKITFLYGLLCRVDTRNQ